ncbi:MAG: DUF1800 domain-containing protein [Gammaproteobacteria bacterium]|nr:DUF1800 domain-containing protein [Gammaproteobacteria bacterium]
MTTEQAAAAANRFGLGARPGDLPAIGSEPRGWLLAQLGPAPPIDSFDGLPDSRDYLADYDAFQQEQRERRERRAQGDADAAKGGGGRRRLQQQVQQELAVRQGVAVASDAGFRERLVRFWSNHFAISVDKFRAASFAAPMEREAIRPHATGRFADLLLAVERHPGMLLYLDNAQSVGNDSRLADMGRRRAVANPRARARGLNENLAREIMELHTLGVDGGYTQADVIEFARAITGWGVARRGEAGRGDSGFAFHAGAHEPGARQVLGRRFAQQGEEQGVAILHMLALHPATARHLALQLARHFVADDPPPALVARMATAYLDSGGELTALYRTMIDDDAAWSTAARKLKTPDDFMVSALRACALGSGADLALALRLQGQMGQPVFQPRSPAGFGDLAADWGGPDALFKRVQAAQLLAGRLPDRPGLTPLALGQQALGGTLDEQTATALRRAESVQQGVALLLASPAFQWRA